MGAVGKLVRGSVASLLKFAMAGIARIKAIRERFVYTVMMDVALQRRGWS